MLFEEKHLLLVVFKLLHSYSLAPMNNLSVLKPTFLFFFFFILLPVTIVSYKPTDDIALSCGISGSSNSSDGRQWTGDVNSKFAPIEQSNEKSVTATANTQDVSVETVPYMTARISRSQFTYTFPVTPGRKFIRLHFYPTSYPPDFDKYNDFFTVKAGRFTLLQNFSASILSDYWLLKSLFREYCLNVEEGDHKLNITFTPTFSPSNETYAFINAIEIVSMPTSLYYTSPSDSEGLHAVGQNDTLRIENDTALENVYRFNVGGRHISQMEDTGMYREWIDDSVNMYPAPAGAVSINWTIPLNWSKIPAYTAPEDVYRTARSMGPNLTMNRQSDLTWLLLVDYGFWHLIRLHFCEYDPIIEAGNDRLFNISIDNKIAEEEFGVTKSSGGKGIPMYKDYAVMIENSTEPQSGQYWLYLTLRPVIGYYVDALLNGIEVFKLSNHDGNLAGPNTVITVTPTVPVPVQQPSSPIQKSKTSKTLIIASVGSAAGLLLILSLFCCMLIWQLRKRKRSGSDYKPSWCWWWLDPNKGKSLRTTTSLPDERCRHFSLAEIKAATHNFHEDLIIGTGGFGKVFKGIIDEGSVNEDPMAVAIKRLNPESRQGASEFWTEIEMLSHLRHVHLVSLIGYCNEEGEMILVYDFMINGTLRDHLYNTKNDPLPWTQRLVICKGAAIGLNYLHTEFEHTIIHRDVKSTNILLDEKWTAKVSDFGLSKIDPKNSLMNTLVKGTPGYMDPEYARGHPLTVKSDVYSFGVVLLEVLCARRAVDIKLGEDQASLANWAIKCIDDGTIYNIIDPNLMGKIVPECFKAFVGIVESCLRDEGIQRPTMNDVMEKLTFTLELQEKADAEKEKIYPGGEYMYPAISFHVARHDDVDGGTDMDSSIYTSTTMDTLTTGTSFTS